VSSCVAVVELATRPIVAQVPGATHLANAKSVNLSLHVSQSELVAAAPKKVQVPACGRREVPNVRRTRKSGHHMTSMKTTVVVQHKVVHVNNLLRGSLLAGRPVADVANSTKSIPIVASKVLDSTFMHRLPNVALLLRVATQLTNVRTALLQHY